MPRAARIHAPHQIFHIISRCLNHEYLFRGDEERTRYLELLGRGLGRTDAKVLAWCVMSNHVHLVVRSGEEPLWRLMKRVQSGFATWCNRRNRRIGPVFSERYRAVLVEEEPYLMELIRYVHLNPVRAELVARPEDSDWSSHRCCLGLAAVPDWYDPGEVLRVFGETKPRARASLRRFVDEGIGEPRSPLLSGDSWLDIFKELRTGNELRVSDPILGTEEFISELMKKNGSHAGRLQVRSRASRKQVRPPISSLIDLVGYEVGLERTAFSEQPKRRLSTLARQLLVRLWVQEYRGSQVELARHLGVPASLVSRWYSKGIERIDELADRYGHILDALPRAETHQSLETGATNELEGDITRISVNIELQEEQPKIATPPRKSSRS